MDGEQKQNIASFVIRFVQDKPEKQVERGSFRGTIRHIQMDQEIPFIHWDDAVSFIQRFVPVDQMERGVETRNVNQ
jgi:hypothetical protein